MTNTEQRIRDSLHKEAEALPTPTWSPDRGRSRSIPGWALSAVAAAAVLLLAVGGLISWSGFGDGEPSATALPVAVARMTAVFRPGELTDAEWDDFSSLVARYDSAIGYVPVDQATAHQQAVALFSDDANALAVLNDYPDIASAYAQVDFANTEDAYAFQETAGSADYIVAIMGVNGPRLARGYATSPELGTPGEDNARSTFWTYAYQSNLPTTIGTSGVTTTTSPLVFGVMALPDGFAESDSGFEQAIDPPPIPGDTSVEVQRWSFTRGDSADDPNWGIIKVRIFSGGFDAADWLAAYQDRSGGESDQASFRYEATTVGRNANALMEAAIKEKGRFILRFGIDEYQIMISTSGNVSEPELRQVAEGITSS